MLRARVSELEVSLEARQNQLKVKVDELLSTEQQANQELATKAKLVALYKEQSEGSKARLDELVGVVAELQKLLAAEKGVSAAATQQAEDAAAASARQIAELTASKEATEAELTSANDLLNARGETGAVGAPASTGEGLEAMSAMYPGAAGVSEALRSGLNLTQIYSKMVDAERQLKLEQAERARLEGYLTQVLEEVEARAPALRKQRADLVKSEELNVQYRASLEAANAESAELDEKVRDLERKTKYLHRQNQRYARDTQDLGKQIQGLLRQAEERGGGTVSESPATTANDSMNADQIISAKLVSVASIAEMQEQNAMLRAALRELGEEREEEERARADAADEEHRTEMAKLRDELQEVSQDRNRQTQLVEAIVRQRDMFKAMAQTAPGATVELTEMVTESSPLPPASPAPSVTGTPVDSSGSSSVPAPSTPNMSIDAVRELQRSFEGYRAEREANDKIIAANEEKLRADFEQSKNAATVLNVKHEQLNDRFTELRTSFDAQEAELKRVRESKQQLHANMVDHQQRLERANAALADAHEDLRRSQRDCEDAIRAKALLEQSEAMSSAEAASLKKQVEANNEVLINMQKYESNARRAEEEMKNRLSTRVDELVKKRDALLEQVALERDRVVAAKAEMATEVQRLAAEATVERKAHQAVREELIAARVSTEAAEKEVRARQAQLEASEHRLTMLLSSTKDTEAGTAPALGDAVTSEQLSSAMANIASLQTDLNEATEQAEQYRSIANAAEEQLKDLNRSAEDFKLLVEAREAEAAARTASLNEQIATLTGQITELTVAKAEAETAAREAETKYTEYVQSVKDDLAAASEAKAAAEKSEAAAHADCKRQAAVATENIKNYEQQVKMHAQSIEEFAQTKEEAERASAALKDALSELEDLKSAAARSEAAKIEEIRVAGEGAAMAGKTLEELRSQNELLHKHLEEAQRALLKAQESALPAPVYPAKDDGFDEDSSTKSSEELWQVIRYEHAQAQIAQTECEQAKLDSERLRQRVEHFERQLGECQDQLQAERERVQTQAMRATEHAELLSKLESHQMVLESNRLLRDDKERCEQELAAKTSEAAEAAAVIVPLKAELAVKVALVASLGSEKLAADQLVQTWKQRCTQLKDQYQKIDADEHRRFKADSDALGEFRAKAEADAKLSAAAVAAAETAAAKAVADASEVKEALAKSKERGDKLNRAGVAWKKKADAFEAQLKEAMEKLEGSTAAQDAAASKANSAVAAELAKVKADYEKAKVQREKLRQNLIDNKEKIVEHPKLKAELEALKADAIKTGKEKETLAKEKAEISKRNQVLSRNNEILKKRVASVAADPASTKPSTGSSLSPVAVPFSPVTAPKVGSAQKDTPSSAALAKEKQAKLLKEKREAMIAANKAKAKALEVNKGTEQTKATAQVSFFYTLVLSFVSRVAQYPSVFRAV